MKIVVNYDLLTRIEEANGCFKIYKQMKAKFHVVAFTYILVNAFISISRPLSWADLTISGIGALLGTFTGTRKNIKRYGFRKQLIAIRDLCKLIDELKNHGIDTSYELLILSEEINKSLNLKELKEDKYIEIPTNAIYGNSKVSIHQEHYIGSKVYTLSIGSPQKKLKLAYNPI